MTTPCICTTLRRAAAASTRHYDAVLAPSGLSATMFRLMRQTARAGTPTISALAAIVDLDRSTLGRNLRVLEKRGLIEMVPAEDARARKITLTDDGVAALSAAEPLWTRAQREFAALVDPATLAALTRIANAPHTGATP